MAEEAPARPVPDSDDAGTIYLFHGGRGALGYSLGEGDDAYLHWDYDSGEVNAYTYSDQGWLDAWAAYDTGEDNAAAAAERVRGWPEMGGCVFLGGYGYPLVIRQPYDLTFSPDRLVAATPVESVRDIPSPGAHGLVTVLRGGRQPVVDLPLDEVTRLEIGGPGAVTSGGGFAGGGFGLQGFLEGAGVAALLNALTTRTKIHTLLRVEATGGEMTFFYSGETPTDLRITLAPVFSHLRQRDPQERQAQPPGIDPVNRLATLADLLDRGLLTREEFDEAKAKLLDAL